MSTGLLDPAFDTDGIVAPNFSDFSDDRVNDMQLLPDGRVLLTGTADRAVTVNDDFPNDVGVMRLNANGSLDTSFGGAGRISYDFGTSDAAGNSVEVRSSGKILVGGFANNGTDNDFLILQLNTDGTLDSSFGTGGIVLVFDVGDRSILVLRLQSDGKVLAGGSGRILRFNTDGSRDFTFGSGGVVNPPHSVTDILLDDADSFFVTGSSSGQMSVSKYTSGGSIDTDFDDDGTASAAVPGHSCSAKSLAKQQDGKLG